MIHYVMLIIVEIASLINGHCIDIHSQVVSQGLHYVPGPNSCTVCICEKGNPKWCKSVLCSPPQDCQSFQVGNSCCEFKCLDDILNKTDNYSDTYDIALRLIASVVTAVLSLSLLFFLIHRLRQRKIRLSQNHQLNDDHHSFTGIGYITGNLGYLSGSMGYLSSGNNDMEYHYNEAGYPFWKPMGNYFPRGEAPPPYEEAVRAARTEPNLLNMNTNMTPFSFTTNGTENVSLTLVHNTHVNITPSVQNQNVEHVETPHCNMRLQNEQSSEQVNVEDHQVNNSSTNVRLVCRQGASKNCTVNSSSTVVQNAMVVNQVDVNSDTSMTLPIIMLSSNKSRSENEQLKGHLVNSKNNQPVNSIPQQPQVDKSFSSTCNTNATSNLKNISSDNKTLGRKISSNASTKDVKKSKASAKVYVKTCESTKTSSLDSSCSKPSIVSNPNSSFPCGTNHRTIPQVYSTALKLPSNSEIWIAEEINSKKKQTKDQYNSYKTLNTTSQDKSCSIRRSDISVHCTLPMGLRELNSTFNLRPNKQITDEQSSKSDTKESNCSSASLLAKGDTDDSNCEIFYTNIEPLRNKLHAQSDKKKQGKYKSNSQKSSSNSKTERNKSVSNQESQDDLSEELIQNSTRSTTVASPSISTDGRKVAHIDNKSLNAYYCMSPIQDLDDYRSECENCKSLSFETCSEEMDVLNETMTLQRHPIEQDENQKYYRTSLTLPSHSKKVRSVTLNTSRESWFMAMQEITSSSESD